MLPVTGGRKGGSGVVTVRKAGRWDVLKDRVAREPRGARNAVAVGLGLFAVVGCYRMIG